MAIVTVQELIAQREKIKDKKTATYELQTSIGAIVVRIPSGTQMAEAWEIDNNFESNCFLVYNAVVKPDLTSRELHEAFGVFEPTEIVQAIFPAGEINKIVGKLLELGNYKGKIAAKLYDETKKQ